MTATPTRFLIQGRDYEWVPSTREGYHSFCYLTTEAHDGNRVASLQRDVDDRRWILTWGPDDAGFFDGDWQRQQHRFLLDAHDEVARRLPHYVAQHQHLLLAN